MGRLCYPTQASGQGPGTLARKLSRCKPAWLTPVRQGGYGTCFCCQAVNIIEFYECRGTKLISGREFLPVDEV